MRLEGGPSGTSATRVNSGLSKFRDTFDGPAPGLLAVEASRIMMTTGAAFPTYVFPWGDDRIDILFGPEDK
jgi:hypothetical protein